MPGATALERLFAAAYDSAKHAGRSADLLDYLAAAIADEELGPILRMIGLDTDRTSTVIAAYRGQRRLWWQRLFGGSIPSLASLLERAARLERFREGSTIGALDLIDAMLWAGDEWSALLDSHGLKPLPLRRFIAHGRAPNDACWHAPGELPPGSYTVVFHNDPFTAMAFVVHILESEFGLSPDQAVQVMMDVHHATAFPVGSWPAAEARTHVARAIESAALAGFPLLVTLQPPNPWR